MPDDIFYFWCSPLILDGILRELDFIENTSGLKTNFLKTNFLKKPNKNGMKRLRKKL